MDKKKFILPLLIASSFSFAGCSALQFDKYIDVVVRDLVDSKVPESEWEYTDVYKTKVNIYNSAILPEKPLSEWPTNKAFLGYGPKDFVKGESKRKDFFRGKGLVRYNDIKQYAVNNTVTLKAAYCDPDDVPTKYLVVGWYARTKTSGLSEEIMKTFEKMLYSHLEEVGTTQKALKDVEVRAYDGDVATIGGDIAFDGDVDIFLGAGVNLGTQGGVTYYKRNAYDIEGAADRYIYRLTEDGKKEQAEEVYTWMRSTEVKNFFKGK